MIKAPRKRIFAVSGELFVCLEQSYFAVFAFVPSLNVPL